MPTQVALGRLGFGDARLPHAAFESLQLFARVIPLVGDDDAGRILARRQSDLVEVARGGVQRPQKRRRIAFVGRMDRRRHDDAGVEIDRVLRLVSQMRRSVLHLGDPGVGSVGLFQSAFDSVLPLRLRSKRARSSAVGVSIPLSCAIRVSIAR